MFYDAKFGRKRLPESANGPTADKPSSNVNSAAVTSNGNIHVNNTSDMAIFEMFRGQVVHLIHPMGNLY